MVNQQKKIENKQRKYSLLIKNIMVEELSGYLDTLIANDILKYSEVKKDFGVDYDTIKNVQKKESTVSLSTLQRLVWVVAYYLDAYRRKIESQPDGVEKILKIKALPKLENEFVRIYGCVAERALKLAKEEMDLRQVVRE